MRLMKQATISIYAAMFLLTLLSACTAQQSSGTQYDRRLDRPLLTLIEQGKHTDVLELLDRGADPNASDPIGRSALMYAGLNGQTDTMEILIEKGAQINAKDKMGETPLHAAIMFGDPNAVRLLIGKGADVNAKFYLGSNTGSLSPLGLAKLRFRQSSEKRMSDVLARGRLILHAIKSDYKQIIQMLEDAGAVE
jgi:ankyrin repeat protein